MNFKETPEGDMHSLNMRRKYNWQPGGPPLPKHTLLQLYIISAIKGGLFLRNGASDQRIKLQLGRLAHNMRSGRPLDANYASELQDDSLRHSIMRGMFEEGLIEESEPEDPEAQAKLNRIFEDDEEYTSLREL